MPKDAPDGCSQSLMGAIERALRNSSNRKGKYIFEPTVGMTFDCVSELRNFIIYILGRLDLVQRREINSAEQCKNSDANVM